MKKQQKTETPQNTTEPSSFLDKNVISANKIMKNEANFNSVKFTATSCRKECYNDLSPKTQNGTNPNEANFPVVLLFTCLPLYSLGPTARNPISVDVNSNFSYCEASFEFYTKRKTI